MRNGELVQASSKGNLVIETNIGTTYFKEVWLVPGLEENLLSIA